MYRRFVFECVMAKRLLSILLQKSFVISQVYSLNLKVILTSHHSQIDQNEQKMLFLPTRIKLIYSFGNNRFFMILNSSIQEICFSFT